MDIPISSIEEIDSTLNPITEPDGLELLGHIKTQPVVMRRFSRAIFKIQQIITDFRNRLSNLEGACTIRPSQYFITEETSNPAVIWPGTTWEKLEGRVLIGAGGSFQLKSEGGVASITLALANIPGHTHSFSATTNSAGNHTHKSGNHRHRVDNHAHSQPTHYHLASTFGMDNTGGGSGGGTRPTSGDNPPYSTQNGRAGGENTGGSTPYTDYQNPTTDTRGNHSHTVSGTTGSIGSGSSLNILNPYRAVNIWRRVS